LFSSTGKGNYFYMENFELTVAYYTDSSWYFWSCIGDV
jgi:hypothetical protein